MKDNEKRIGIRIRDFSMRETKERRETRAYLLRDVLASSSSFFFFFFT